jgi:hypothetical protein
MGVESGKYKKLTRAMHYARGRARPSIKSSSAKTRWQAVAAILAANKKTEIAGQET